MKINQLKIGSLLSYLQMGLSLIIGLLYTPVMIRLLGQSEYGLYNTVSSTISMMSVLSLGFNVSYIRFFSKYKKENDTQSIYRLNGLFLLIYGVIAAIVVACGVFLTTHLELVFDEGLTAGEYEIARVLMALLTANLAVSFPMSVFSSIISAHEKFVLLKLLGIGKTVVGPLVTLPLLLMGYRSIAMVAVTVAITWAVDICYLFFVLVKLKQRFLFGRVEKGLFRSIFNYTFFIAINMIVDQINWSMGKFLLGRFHGTSAVAIYSVGYTLYNHYHLFSTAISGVFTPRIHKTVLKTADDQSVQRQALTSLFTRVGRIQFLCLSLVATGIVFFGKPFIVNIWAGAEYGDSYAVTLLLVFSSMVALIQNLGIEIQRALNRHQFRSLAYIVMAIINLCMTVIFCRRYGAIGAALGTAISLVVANGLIMNVYYHKKCNIDVVYFWKNILRLAVGLIPPVAAGMLIDRFFDLNNLWVFGGSILLYVAVYVVSMWLLGMNEYEKNLVTKPVKKILRKTGARA